MIDEDCALRRTGTCASVGVMVSETVSPTEMSPTETARRAKVAIIELGAAFGHEPAFADVGTRFGLDRWPFYFGARAGVLGPVDADVVVAACGFFAPDLVRPAWTKALATVAPADLVAADVELCVAWARRHLGDVPGVERLADLTDRVVAAADSAARPLFAAWRALANPYGDAATRVGLGLLRLREHRGSSHLIAIAAQDLTPLEAILSGRGPGKAEANGWAQAFPDVADGPARLDAAETSTDSLAGRAFETLDPHERAEFVDLLDAAYRSARPTR